MPRPNNNKSEGKARGGAKRKATAASEKEEQRQLAARVAAIVGMAPRSAGIDRLRCLVGDVKLRTLPEVAKLFGAATNTVNQTWRQGGMPGKTGAYEVAEILAWLLERNGRQRRKTAPASDHDDLGRQLAELELREKLAATRFKELRTAEKEGSLVSRDIVVADLHTAISIFREQVMGVPQRMKPMWPRDRAHEWGERMEHFLRQALVQVSEISVEEFVKRRNQFEGEEDAADQN